MNSITLWQLGAVATGVGLGAIGAAVSAWLPRAPGAATRISVRRLAAMAGGGLLLGVWAAVTLDGALAVIGAGLGAWLLLVAVIDGEHFWLPNLLTLPLGAAGLAVGVTVGPGQALDHVIGAAAGFLALTLIAVLYQRLRGREGLGGGDPRLLGALGAWVGWMGLPSVLVWGSAAGLAWVAAKALVRGPPKPDDRLPFGVFLAIGGWLTWLYGPIGRAGW